MSVCFHIDDLTWPDLWVGFDPTFDYAVLLPVWKLDLMYYFIEQVLTRWLTDTGQWYQNKWSENSTKTRMEHCSLDIKQTKFPTNLYIPYFHVIWPNTIVSFSFILQIPEVVSKRLINSYDIPEVWTRELSIYDWESYQVTIERVIKYDWEKYQVMIESVTLSCD